MPNAVSSCLLVRLRAFAGAGGFTAQASPPGQQVCQSLLPGQRFSGVLPPICTRATSAMTPTDRPVRPPHLGILMLATRFPRPPGDIGNPATFAFPVRYRTVEAASAQRVVRERASGLVDRFIDLGREMAEEGAAGIATSCGFLAAFQPELAAALPVPVATSSLLQAAWIAPLLPAGRRVGIVTIDAAALDE